MGGPLISVSERERGGAGADELTDDEQIARYAVEEIWRIRKTM